jgi:hypothetical protein
VTGRLSIKCDHFIPNSRYLIMNSESSLFDQHFPGVRWILIVSIVLVNHFHFGDEPRATIGESSTKEGHSLCESDVHYSRTCPHCVRTNGL